ncbi:MAG TPA: hypothetical protein VHX38_26840 [Pseudonocardiaceae bacterium]|nr:hypothetical protein [Pseudonocardiaceae bacterium]
MPERPSASTDPDTPTDAGTLVHALFVVHHELAEAAECIAAWDAGSRPMAELGGVLAVVCSELDRVAALRVLIGPAAPGADVDAAVLAQVDAVASAAARLAAIIRSGHETGTLGPHETSSSLVLASEIVSLAARCVLVVARRGLGGSRASRPLAVTVTCGADWTACVAGCAEFVHLWPVAGIAAVIAALAHLLLRRPAHAVLALLRAGVGVLAPHLPALASVLGAVGAACRAWTRPPRRLSQASGPPRTPSRLPREHHRTSRTRR